MITRALPVLLLLLLSSGCAYQVYVLGNAVPALDDRLSSGATIAIEDHQPEDEDAEVRAETTRKLERLLGQGGYKISTPEKADLLLFFEYERESTFQRINFEPAPTLGGSGIHAVRVAPPYNHSLVMRLIDGKVYREQEEAESYWNGEAVLNNTQLSGVKVVDLLLLATFDHFPRNLDEPVKVSLGLENARARDLRRD